MATFEYVEFPADVVRLKQGVCEPERKIRTRLPEEQEKHENETKSTLEMLLNTSPSAIVASAIVSPNPRQQPHGLLSTRDPLSVPIMTANFRRFISKVGPIFWLQDRVEEIILWKRGWKRTAVWLAAYAFFCCFPRMALLIPHIALLVIMLYYYPDPGAPPVQGNVGEGTIDWQANVQAIQNLMGAFSDAHDAIVPLLPYLRPPQTPPPPPPSPKPRSLFAPTPPQDSVSKPLQHGLNGPAPAIDPQPHHPLLIVTLLSFLLLLPLLMIDLLPLRLLFFLTGTGAVAALHPCICGPLSSILLPALSGTGPGLSLSLSITPPRLPCLPFPLARHQQSTPLTPTSPAHTFTCTMAPRDIYILLRRLVHDDRLDDTVWRAPQAQVELWENERWTQDVAEGRRRKSAGVSLVREGEEDREEDRVSSSMMNSADLGKGTVTGSGVASVKGGTWSKAHLRPNERIGWTRGRDGWSGVGGEVSSNLTFSLSPGWAFIETEGWQPDLIASWAVSDDAGVPSSGARTRMSVCEGADQDGWTYTTDTWIHPRPDGRPSEGWVTRRRRWVRRVYFKGVE